MVLTYKMSQTTSNITKTCNKCTNCIKTIKATTQFVVFLFVHSWEQRKFSELVLIERGGSPRPIDDYITDAPDGLNWVKIGDAPTQGHYITKTAEKIKPEGLSKTRQVQPGDLILSNSMSFGKPYIMAINGCIHDGWLLIRDTNNVFDLTFLCHLLGTTQMLGQYKQFAAGSTVNNLNKELVGNTIVTIPSKPEQKVLGEYFESIDNLITLHQREFFRLILAFFCCNSTSILPISWEQRKLGDIGKARSGVGFPDADQGGVTGVPFFKVSDMNLDGNENEMIVANNYVTAEQIADHRWSPITELPAIFFAKVGAAVMLNRKRLCRFPFLLDNNTMAYSLSPTKWDADFAKALFGTVDLTSLVQVGALPSYKAGDVESMEIYLPSLFEQEQIGAFFKQLDNLITLHQCECLGNSHALSILPCPLSSRKMTSFWEQRKLGDIVDVRSGKDYKHLSEGNIPVYGTGGYMLSVNQALSYDEDAIGIGRKGTIDKPYILKAPFWTVDTLFYAVPRQNSDLDFVFDIFQNIDWKKKDESTGVPSLSKTAINEIDISAPCLEEQQVIGSYFSKIDNLITLHQRECLPKTCSLASWFYQQTNRKMTSFWEQRKAKELCSISTGKSNTQDQVDDGKYPFYIRSDIPVRSNKYLYDCEAVITIGDGNIGKVFHYVNGKFDLHQRCYKMTDFQDIWGKYFFYYFSTKFYDRAMKMTAKATVDSVRLEMISEMDIKQPFQISEQKQIAEFFDYLNNLITLHQCKDFSLKSVFEESKNFISALRKNTSWEQRKLGELALFNPKDALPQTFEYVDLESVVGTEMLSHRTEVKSSAPSRAQRLAHTGDLFYQTVRPYQKNNYLFEKPDNNYVFSTGYAQMRPYVDGYFLLSLVQSEHFVKVVLDNCTGTSYPAINANDLAEIEVTAPSDESEAQKIGTIFRNIDNLITLHQRIKIFFTGDYHDQKNK